MLCENLDTLDEAEAKASMIWIIGEYAERIDNADELLEQFLVRSLPSQPSFSLSNCVRLRTSAPVHNSMFVCCLKTAHFQAGLAV